MPVLVERSRNTASNLRSWLKRGRIPSIELRVLWTISQEFIESLPAAARQMGPRDAVERPCDLPSSATTRPDALCDWNYAPSSEETRLWQTQKKETLVWYTKRLLRASELADRCKTNCRSKVVPVILEDAVQRIEDRFDLARVFNETRRRSQRVDGVFVERRIGYLNARRCYAECQQPHEAGRNQSFEKFVHLVTALEIRNRALIEPTTVRTWKRGKQVPFLATQMLGAAFGVKPENIWPGIDGVLTVNSENQRIWKAFYPDEARSDWRLTLEDFRLSRQTDPKSATLTHHYILWRVRTLLEEACYSDSVIEFGRLTVACIHLESAMERIWDEFRLREYSRHPDAVREDRNDKKALDDLLARRFAAFVARDRLLRGNRNCT